MPGIHPRACSARSIMRAAQAVITSITPARAPAMRPRNAQIAVPTRAIAAMTSPTGPVIAPHIRRAAVPMRAAAPGQTAARPVIALPAVVTPVATAGRAVPAACWIRFIAALSVSLSVAVSR